YLFDKLNGRTFLEHGGIIVNGGAEKRDHPLIDQVLAIVTLPVGNTGPGNSSVETIGLRNGPHGHVTAVTTAGDAEAVRLDWIFLSWFDFHWIQKPALYLQAFIRPLKALGFAPRCR